nr:ABC-three component system protein [Limosilactobacillus mucosae]
MVVLDLAIYIATLKKYMRHKNTAVLVDALFGSIAGPLGLKILKGQHKGEDYKVSSGRASELLNRKRNPDAQISAGADNPKVLSTIDDYFDSAVLDLLMMGDSLDALNDELTNEIKSDVHLPESIKKELLEKSKSSNISSFLAAIFLYVVKVDNTGKPECKLESIKNVPLSNVSFDAQDNKLHISSLTVPLPESIAPKNIRNEEFKYLNALCQAYSDRLNMTITIDNIDSCPKKRFRNDFNDERNYYNSVQSRIRGVREIFSDVDEQYNVLKKDAYEGIKETYLDDYPDGFKRLVEVLKKITSTSLNRSQLVKLDIIGNAERKGLCHVLVNDGYIKSWVDVDE